MFHAASKFASNLLDAGDLVKRTPLGQHFRLSQEVATFVKMGLKQMQATSLHHLVSHELQLVD